METFQKNVSHTINMYRLDKETNFSTQYKILTEKIVYNRLSRECMEPAKKPANKWLRKKNEKNQ